MIMKSILFLSMLLISSVGFAKPQHSNYMHGGNTIMRMVYANTWKKTIVSMFADAGPTRVYLDNNILVITNANCNTPEVKAILRDTFSPREIKAKMREINMRIRCDTTTTLASR